MTKRAGSCKLRGPYLCKCPRIRVAPCATFLPPIFLRPSKLTSLATSLSLFPSKEEERERKVGNRGGKERWRGQERKKRYAQNAIRKRFIFEYSLKGESALRKLGNGKESAGLNKTTPLKPSLLGRRGGTISISRPLPVETFHIQFVPLVSR